MIIYILYISKINMYKYIIYGTLYGISGSVLYKCVYENVKNKHRNLFNPGILVGLTIGLLRSYLKKTILYKN
jgi:H+/Cl- antiporter ClcA